MSGRDGTTVHATCLLLDEVGLLLRGPSGCGKSTLARALLDGGKARLVGDDRVLLSSAHGRVIARGHPAVAGLIELRGIGPLAAARTAEAAVLRLLVDLGRDDGRCPEPQVERVLGVPLPRLSIPHPSSAAGPVLWRVCQIHDMMTAQ